MVWLHVHKVGQCHGVNFCSLPRFYGREYVEQRGRGIRCTSNCLAKQSQNFKKNLLIFILKLFSQKATFEKIITGNAL